MSFTDDDLNGFKETLSEGGDGFMCQLSKMKALLARLEAAEIPYTHEHESIGGVKPDGTYPCGNTMWSDGTCHVIREGYKIWRKAAGKR